MYVRRTSAYCATDTTNKVDFGASGQANNLFHLND